MKYIARVEAYGSNGYSFGVHMREIPEDTILFFDGKNIKKSLKN